MHEVCMLVLDDADFPSHGGMKLSKADHTGLDMGYPTMSVM